MSIQSEFDVQRVVAAIRAELGVEPGTMADQHALELAEYTVQLARVQAELEESRSAEQAAKTELAANITYQQEALTRAATALASGDRTQLQSVLQFAGASFAEKERQKKLERAAELKAEAAALEAEAV